MTTEISASRKLVDTMKFSYFVPFVTAAFAAALSTAEADHNNMDVVIDKELVKPCNIDDLDCLKKSTESFLNHTYMGIPALDIIPIDPLSIPALDVKMDDSLVYEIRNIIVKGMRHQQLLDFKMDMKAKSVKLTTAADLNVDGDVTVSKGERLCGAYRGRVLGTVSYNYELKKDKGIEFFVVGPETIACQPITPTDAQCNAELQRVLSSDAGGSAHAAHAHNDEALCAVAKAAYSRAVQNIRAAARILPASAFFNNIHGNY